MKNCLKTKLKSSVDNDNLLCLGEEAIPVTIPDNGNICTLIIEYADNSKMRIIGDGNFLDSSGNVLPTPKSINISANQLTWVYISPGTYSLVIDKYVIKYFTFINNKIFANLNGIKLIDTFKYAFNLTDLEIGYSENSVINFNDFMNKNIYPNLEKIGTNGCKNTDMFLDLDLIDTDNAQKLITINLSSSVSDINNLKGNINNLNFRVSRNSMIYLKDSIISGELSTLFDKLVAEQNNGSILFCGNGICTINGNVITKGSQVNVTVTPSGWSIN